MNDIILLVAATPPLFLVYQIYKIDAVEHEPVGLIIKLLVGGGAVTIAASLLEYFFSFLYAGDISALAAQLIHYFLVVAVIEECCKYVVLRLMTWNNPAFNYTFDGVVYAVSASLGFALVENVMYTAALGIKTGLIRAFTAIVLHAVCGVFMGCYYGASKKCSVSGNANAASMMNARSLIVPILIHGTYDFCASNSSTIYTAAFFIFLIFLYFIAYNRIKSLERNDTPIQGPGPGSFGGGSYGGGGYGGGYDSGNYNSGGYNDNGYNSGGYNDNGYNSNDYNSDDYRRY
ncbi:MAG: PrsW family intramembrane metalloprotease [Anaerovoracaceae bacterium]